jgi:geranylgeranyl diphosphate synthase, type I
MSLDKLVVQMRPEIEQNMIQTLVKYNSTNASGMFDMLNYHLGWEKPFDINVMKGKRVRPLLVLLSCYAVGGIWKHALPAASAVEFVHNFSLIHDDIQDNSDLRRGKNTVWKEWGRPQAINAGDAMFALSHLALEALDTVVPLEISHKAHQILPNACLTLTKGQYLDISYENRQDITIDDYWPMVNGKTASLIATSTEIGSLIGGATEALQIIFKEFGNLIGLAFQVYDDYLGIWGNEETTGKSIASDLISGKKSLPVLFGLKQKGKFENRWNKGPILETDIKEVSKMLIDEGAKEYTLNKSEELTNQAIQLFNDANINSEAGEPLLSLSKNLVVRKN